MTAFVALNALLVVAGVLTVVVDKLSNREPAAGRRWHEVVLGVGALWTVAVGLVAWRLAGVLRHREERVWALRRRRPGTPGEPPSGGCPE